MKKFQYPDGRPSDYSDKLAAEICGLISEGNSLRSICEKKSMPSCSTIFLWLTKHSEFSEQYARAREEQADAISDECLFIAETEPDIARARLMIDTRKWFASKMKPRKYGDRQMLEHTDRVTTPVEKITRDMSQEEASRLYHETLKRMSTLRD